MSSLDCRSRLLRDGQHCLYQDPPPWLRVLLAVLVVAVGVWVVWVMRA